MGKYRVEPLNKGSDEPRILREEAGEKRESEMDELGEDGFCVLSSAATRRRWREPLAAPAYDFPQFDPDEGDR